MSPALTACPHGLASEATTAPGKVLSSLAFSTLADSQYADRSRSASCLVSPGKVFGGGFRPLSYARQVFSYAFLVPSKGACADLPATSIAWALVVPKPSASVNRPSFPTSTCPVCTTLPSSASSYVVARLWSASSWASPSLAVPAYPLLASRNGRSARSAPYSGTA